MQFEQLAAELTQRLVAPSFIQGTISQPRMKSSDLKRVKLKPVQLKNELFIQMEYQYERVLQHYNIPFDELQEKLQPLVELFKQIHLECTDEKVQVQLSKKFKVFWKTDNNTSSKQVQLAHNRKKNYLLDPNSPYPFLIRLGIQTAEGKVKSQKQQKFRQINRFLEFIDDSLRYLPTNRPIRIIDFGSGKSYLTFALYHYLHIEKGLAIQVTGLDLKKEVIEHCQQIADDLQYKHLQFVVGDISDYSDTTSVDMVVTLHACDVATDLALSYAIDWQAKVILSVPCCQHELFGQLQAPKLDVMLQHGLIKERFAALATDAMRAQLLTLKGYETQILEFIDMEHTAKNILIRAYYSGKEPTTEAMKQYEDFRDLLNATPFLEQQLKKTL